MAEWYEGNNLNRIAAQFASAFQRASVASSSGGGSSSRRAESMRDTVDDEIKVRKSNVKVVKTSSREMEKFNKKLRESMKNMGDRIEDVAKAVLNFKGVPELTRDFASGLQQGVESGTYFNRQFDMMSLGIPVERLNEFDKASRQAQRAMGGYSTWVSQLESQSHDMFNRFGDTIKSTKFMTDSMENFVHTGVNPSLDSLRTSTTAQGRFSQSILKSMDELTAMGVNAEEFNEIMNDASKDTLVRNRLRGAADERTRLQILRSYAARQAEFKAMGMNTEQVKEASKALEELGGQKPLDRYRQAAKAFAALTAMGVQGAEAVSDFIRAGDRATESQRVSAARVMGAAQDLISESRRGSIAKEMFTATLATKSGIEDLVNAQGPFSTKLDQQAKISDQMRLNLAKITVNTSPTSMESVMNNITWGRLLLVNVIDNNGVLKLSLGALNVIGNTVSHIWEWLEKEGGKTGGGVAVGAASLGKKLVRGVGRLGAAGAAAYGTYQAGQAITTGRSDIHDLLISTKWGAWLSDKIGAAVTHGMAAFGSKEAKHTLEIQKKAEQEAITRGMAAFSNKEGKRSLEAQKKAEERASREREKEHRTKEKLDTKQAETIKESTAGVMEGIPQIQAATEKQTSLQMDSNEWLQKITGYLENAASAQNAMLEKMGVRTDFQQTMAIVGETGRAQ